MKNAVHISSMANLVLRFFSSKKSVCLTAFFLLVAACSLTGNWIYRNQLQRTEKKAFLQLKNSVSLKAHHLERWLVEREGDCVVLSHSPEMVEQTKQIVKNFDSPKPSESVSKAKNQILERFSSMVDSYGYSSIRVVAPLGQTLLSTGKYSNLPINDLALIQKAIAENRVIRGDFTLSETGPVYFDYVVPIFEKKGNNPQAVAFIFLQIDANSYLFPLIQTWPFDSESAETLLVEKVGSEIVYFNELRHKQKTSLVFKLPANNENSPAAVAINSTEPGQFTGIDYRGIPVFSYYHPIAKTNWRLIGTIDKEEVYSPLAHFIFWIFGLAMIFLFLMLALLASIYRHQHQSATLQMLQSESDLIKKNKQALVEKQEVYESVISTSLDGFAMINSKGQFIDVNTIYCNYSEYSRTELLTMLLTDLEVFESPAQFEEHIQHIAQKGHERFETQHRRKSGSIWNVEVNLSCSKDNKDRFIAFFRDITESKSLFSELQSNRELLQSQNQILEQMVESRTLELAKALELAHQADRAKDMFLASVSHEMRTPLNAIIGLTTIAHKQTQEPRTLDYLHKIHSAGENLGHTINDILDLSKLVSGGFTLEERTFSLRKLLDRCTSIVQYKVDEKGLSLLSKVGKDVPDVLMADSHRIGQILLNFLINALKFTEKGQIEVCVTKQNTQQNKTENSIPLLFEIQDSGIGIPVEDQHKLFLPFSQIESSLSRRAGGTGLGLSINKKLIEAMGGHVEVRSQRGEGSVFSFQLTLKAGDEKNLPIETENGDGLKFKDTQVLVVDDNEMNLEVATQILQSVDIKAITAKDGSEAIRILQSGNYNFDLVFMDIQMPHQDGFETTQLIRAIPKLRSLPIVAMTAYTLKHERQAILDSGLNDHIGKPVSFDLIVEVSRKWISKEKQVYDHRNSDKQISDKQNMVTSQGDHDVLPGDSRILKLKNIDWASAIKRFSKSEDRYIYWLNYFSKTAGEYAPSIRQALSSEQILNSKQSAQAGIAEAHQLAHTFKGRVVTLGLTELEPLAIELDRLLKSKMTLKTQTSKEILTEIEPNLSQFEKLISNTCAKLKTALGAAPSVMVVDNDELIRDSILRVLASLPIKVVGVVDGQQALNMIQSRPIDLIISDYHMPEMDGIELLKHVRTQNNKVLFIFLTGSEDKNLREAISNYEANGVIHKPISVDSLRDQVRTLLKL